MSSLKTEIRQSFVWNAIENFSRLGIQFIIGVILARLLDASDYGVLGIISVFIAVSQTFIDAGFSNALLQKKECTDSDYCTVFWFNVFLGVCVCFILCFSASWIAYFYDSPVLEDIMLIIGLSLVFQSFFTINKTILVKELKFKHLAVVTFSFSLLSGLIAIYLAYNGFGVWALVSQSVISTFFSGFVYFYASKWIPKFVFSKESFRRLFSFGSKLFVSNLLFTIFNNIYNLFIGKCFPPAILGYFTRADGYAKLIPNNISGVLQNIMLPVLAKKQDEEDDLIRIYTKFIKLTSFFIYPMSLVFAVLAKPIIILMLTSKWENTIPILQILCIASMFDHIISINNNFLMVRGKSDYILKLSAYSKIFLVFAIVLTFKLGIIAVAYSKVAYSVVTFFISAIYLSKTIPIGIFSTISSTASVFFVSAIIAGYAFLLSSLIPIAWWSLFLVVISSAVLYYFSSLFFMKGELELVKSIKK